MNEQSEPITSREGEKSLYEESQYKDACTTCGKYGHKGKYLWHKEAENVPKFHCCDKPWHINKVCWKIIREEKSKNSQNKDNKKNEIVLK